jgi:hypothetical protein
LPSRRDGFPHPATTPHLPERALAAAGQVDVALLT